MTLVTGRPRSAAGVNVSNLIYLDVNHLTNNQQEAYDRTIHTKEHYNSTECFCLTKTTISANPREKYRVHQVYENVWLAVHWIWKIRHINQHC